MRGEARWEGRFRDADVVAFLHEQRRGVASGSAAENANETT